MTLMPREGTPGGPIFRYPVERPRNPYPRIPFPGFPDLEIPGDFGDSIPRDREPSPSRESCAECRSRQDPNVMHFVDPCRNQCSGGAGDFRIPDPTFPKPRPGSIMDPFDFPPVNLRS